MNKFRILHIAKDEKFINGAYYLFEKAFPGQNEYVIVKPSGDPPIRFLNTHLVVNATFEVTSPATLSRLTKMSDQHQVTVLHGLGDINLAVFNESDRQERFMAIVHGAEIYNSGILNNTLMGPQTKAIYELTQKNNFYDLLKEIYRSIKYRDNHTDFKVNLPEVIFEIKNFGSLPGFTYDHLIESRLYHPSIQRIPFTYYPIEYVVKNDELRASGRHIFLGNSSSATNNHLEAFEFLKNLGLGDRKVVTPLSYGCPKYAKAIIKEGKKMLPDNFMSLTTFLPLEEYNQIISECGIVVMNHYRPQAVGNIIASLYLGAKVFLNDTDVYRYFKQLGCHIYLIEEDLKASKKPFVLLNEKQIKENRTILKNTLSADVLVKGLRYSFRQLFGISSNIRETAL
ncbi:MAG: TDP-N-acetylfucosamine:lipid II N-acetylfucosaminyltransferase [Bacteroidota bacterium]